jgi:uncharacterized membrane protein HdeD (DUF308 family)
MSLPKQPGWLRGLEVGAGLLSLMVAISIFVFPALGVATLVFLLAVGLIFAGARSVSDAEYGRLSKSVRVLGAISGALAIIMAVSVIIFPGLALLSLIVLLSFGLVFYGVGRISLAYSLKATSTGLRAMVAAVGVLDVTLSVAVVLLPGVALLSLVVILGLALFVSGVEMCVSGAAGRTWLGDVAEAARDPQAALAPTGSV